jgi:choline dehydrogenase/4-pyridoxate dehydrogenase
VEYLRAGEQCVAQAEREVIVSGGVVNSPQLLMLSGIGDPEELARHAIAIKASLPGVGRNFQDHVSVFLTFRRKSPGLLHRHMRADRVVFDLARAYLGGSGFATELPSPLAAFLKTDAGLAVPDIQVMLHGGPVSARPYFAPIVKPYEDGFSLIVVLLRPRARGRVCLGTTDPARAALIEQNFLGDYADWETLTKGVRMVRDMARQSALAPYVAGEIAPAARHRTDADIEAHIRASAQTVHHPLGTCKMGPATDPFAVVDERLRVHGLDRLRVVDASVMPDLIGGNINAAVMMIAEKAATEIKESFCNGCF